VDLLRGSVAERRVETFRIVAELDVPRHIFPGMFTCRIDRAVHPLNLQRGIEGFREGVIETRPGAPDRSEDTELGGCFGERPTCILRAAIGMEYRAVGERVVPGGHLQGVDDQIGPRMVGQGVADASLGVTVDHRCQVQPALPGRQVSDIPDELGARLVGSEVAGDEVRDRAGVAGDGGPGSPGPRLARDQVTRSP